LIDLYTVLGVPRDADRVAIRRAYRDKAHTAHPDAGGTPEAFAEIKLAHDILTDDIRRERYDKTGEIGAPTIDSHRAALMEMLSGALDLALLRLSRTPRLPKHLDMVQLTREALRERRKELTDQRTEFERTAERSRELLGRFSVATGDNIMEAVVTTRISLCVSQIESLSSRVRLIDEALEVLDGVTFQAEPDPAPYQPWLSIIETIGTRYA
jgi:curved DNA-binding protein CbpA